LNRQLDTVFPNADDLIQKMELVRTYKDVTFETLNRGDFLPLIQKAFPGVNWEKACLYGVSCSRRESEVGG
jgi:hypothetical protein